MLYFGFQVELLEISAKLKNELNNKKVSDVMERTYYSNPGYTVRLLSKVEQDLFQFWNICGPNIPNIEQVSLNPLTN